MKITLLKIRRALVAGLQIALCLGLVGPQTVLAQYKPGQQHVYPFYYPEGGPDTSAPGWLSSYSGVPAPIAGISYGKYDASRCGQFPGHPAPAGYKTRYDCAEVEGNLVRIETVASGTSCRVLKSMEEAATALFRDLNEFLLENHGGRQLGGWCHRTFAVTVEARIRNGCPRIWRSWSTECEPPTARPGYSRHETGQAIDFYYTSGEFRLYAFRNSKAFDWLVINAEKYGFENYEREPWHWSIDGH